MGKREEAYKLLSNEAKAAQKIKKIKPLFAEIPQNRMIFAENLISQFAVCIVTLERLVEELNDGDVVEEFTQGSQKFLREHPALRAYNSTIKSFTALGNNLIGLLPDSDRKDVRDELMSFITEPRSSKG